MLAEFHTKTVHRISSLVRESVLPVLGREAAELHDLAGLVEGQNRLVRAPKAFVLVFCPAWDMADEMLFDLVSQYFRYLRPGQEIAAFFKRFHVICSFVILFAGTIFNTYCVFLVSKRISPGDTRRTFKTGVVLLKPLPSCISAGSPTVMGRTGLPEMIRLIFVAVMVSPSLYNRKRGTVTCPATFFRLILASHILKFLLR